ncbi:MAG: hypothetical protein PHI66_04410 [Candidatus Pacebacteria bacterium]|nr:hypothetical protein [Candidatus Paceibacterota bacterium]
MLSEGVKKFLPGMKDGEVEIPRKVNGLKIRNAGDSLEASVSQGDSYGREFFKNGVSRLYWTLELRDGELVRVPNLSSERGEFCGSGDLPNIKTLILKELGIKEEKIKTEEKIVQLSIPPWVIMVSDYESEAPNAWYCSILYLESEAKEMLASFIIEEAQKNGIRR